MKDVRVQRVSKDQRAMASKAEAAGEAREKVVILLIVIVVPPEYFLKGLKDPFCP